MTDQHILEFAAMPDASPTGAAALLLIEEATTKPTEDDHA
jgi:hypothetical protein